VTDPATPAPTDAPQTDGPQTDGPHTDGIALVFSRPSDFSQEEAWDAWYDDVHLPDTAAGSGAWVVNRWECADRPPHSSPPVGFSHLAIYQFTDVATGGPALLDLFEQRRAEGALHPAHTIIGVDVLVPTGRWSTWPEPTDARTGQIIAYVGPNDPAIEDEWNAWYDAVHAVDMVDSGAFAGVTRWVRTDRARFGPDHLTIYDVELDDLDDAVALSLAAMGPAHAAGRLHPRHAGGLRSTLRVHGRHGAAGHRP
jgi:hypothetical protein